MSWYHTPIQISQLQVSQYLPHHGRVEATGPTGNVFTRSFDQYIPVGVNDEFTLMHKNVGCVLVSAAMPIIRTTRQASTVGVGGVTTTVDVQRNTTGHAFVQLSDHHRICVFTEYRNGPTRNGYTSPVIGHTTGEIYDYWRLVIEVNGSAVAERIVSTAQNMSNGSDVNGVVFGAWYVRLQDGSVKLCAGLWGASGRNNINLETVVTFSFLPAPTFGAATAMLAVDVDAQEAFVGLAKAGTFRDQPYTTILDGFFIMSYKIGPFERVATARPDDIEAVVDRFGQGLAAMRQDLSNFAQPLPFGTDIAVRPEFGQGLVTIDNGGHPEYPTLRRGQWIQASRLYPKHDVGYLPTGVSNVAETAAANEKLSRLRVQIQNPTASRPGRTLPGLAGRTIECDVVHGFNEYSGTSQYTATELNARVAGQLTTFTFSLTAYVSIHRNDVVGPSNAASVDELTARGDIWLEITLFLRQLSESTPGFTPSDKYYDDSVLMMRRTLTQQQKATLFAGDILGPMASGGTLIYVGIQGDIYVTAIG